MAIYSEVEHFINERIICADRDDRREEWEALKEILVVEGFGGSENDPERMAKDVAEERLAWLRDQRAEGLR